MFLPIANASVLGNAHVVISKTHIASLLTVENELLIELLDVVKQSQRKS